MDVHIHLDDELKDILNQIFEMLTQIKSNGDTMSTGLTALQTALANLVTENQQIAADVTKLLANQQPGLQPGQVIVKQSDIDALTATVNAQTAAEQAEDLLVNPPSPPPPPVVAQWAPNTPMAVGSTFLDSNGNVWTVTTAGTTGATAPTWPTAVGSVIQDGGATETLTALASTATGTVPSAAARTAVKPAVPPSTPAAATMDAQGNITHK
jgi:hypothetical protein